MIHRTRSRLAKLSIAALGAAALLVTIPAPASAGWGDGGGYAYHHRQHRHAGHHGGDCHACGHRVRHALNRHGRAHHGHEKSYYCRPCGHRFRASHRFQRHLIHHHHVPPWRLSFAIVHHAWGWIFFG
jgi:hypothetical protein